MRLEGTIFHASLGRTGMKKRASFKIFVRQIRTTVHKWELWCRLNPCRMSVGTCRGWKEKQKKKKIRLK